MLSEIETQCRFAILAVSDLSQSTISQASDRDRLWFSIQNLLVAVANVSKLLWGDFSAEQMAVREPLRAALHIRPRSPIKWRSVRNHFDHFDERMVDAKHSSFVMRNIGPRAAFDVGDPAQWFHHYDPQSGEVTFGKDAFSLSAVVAEINRIFPLVHAAASEWPPPP